MSADIQALWDFSNPELSEQRFRSALSTASGDDWLILQTQIARTYGLRRDFIQAQNLLGEIASRVQNASVAAQAYYHLELGRTYSSATHAPESQGKETREQARAAFTRAFELAKEAELDRLAVDALHMMTFVDTAAEDQVEWNRKAIAYMQSSQQPEALKWEGALRNNLGFALHTLGRYEDALTEFKLALAARERDGDAQSIRIAHWMIAWTLRSLGRLEEALAIQLRLERECDAVGEPDPYVFEELELLYRGLDNAERAEYYAARRMKA